MMDWNAAIVDTTLWSSTPWTSTSELWMAHDTGSSSELLESYPDHSWVAISNRPPTKRRKGNGRDNTFTVRGNTIYNALGGNDRVTVRRSNNTILGGSGDDELDAGKGRGDNLLMGGGGNDVLTGGGRGDLLVGGGGDDLFVVAQKRLSKGLTTIKDFRLGSDNIAIQNVKRVNALEDLTFEKQGKQVLIKLGQRDIALVGGKQVNPKRLRDANNFVLGAMPTIAITDSTVTEGDSGTTNALFTVTLAEASADTVTVDYAIAPNTATEGIDYTPVNGTLTFTPGTTRQTLIVPIIGDTIDEIDESFFITLNNPSKGILGHSQGIGTIIDNDSSVVGSGSGGSDPGGGSDPSGGDSGSSTPGGNDPGGGSGDGNPGGGSGDGNLGGGSGGGNPGGSDNLQPSLSVDNAVVAEGNTTNNATLTVTLNTPVTTPVTVAYATTDGSAIAGSDYGAVSGTLTFAVNTTSQTITVPILGDDIVESDEAFGITLSNAVGGAIATSQATVTILNDDDRPETRDSRTGKIITKPSAIPELNFQIFDTVKPDIEGDPALVIKDSNGSDLVGQFEQAIENLAFEISDFFGTDNVNTSDYVVTQGNLFFEVGDLTVTRSDHFITYLLSSDSYTATIRGDNSDGDPVTIHDAEPLSGEVLTLTIDLSSTATFSVPSDFDADRAVNDLDYIIASTVFQYAFQGTAYGGIAVTDLEFEPGTNGDPICGDGNCDDIS